MLTSPNTSMRGMYWSNSNPDVCIERANQYQEGGGVGHADKDTPHNRRGGHDVSWKESKEI